jgi:hypothetical protein
MVGHSTCQPTKQFKQKKKLEAILECHIEIQAIPRVIQIMATHPLLVYVRSSTSVQSIVIVVISLTFFVANQKLNK